VLTGRGDADLEGRDSSTLRGLAKARADPAMEGMGTGGEAGEGGGREAGRGQGLPYAGPTSWMVGVDTSSSDMNGYCTPLPAQARKQLSDGVHWAALGPVEISVGREPKLQFLAVFHKHPLLFTEMNSIHHRIEDPEVYGTHFCRYPGGWGGGGRNRGWLPCRARCFCTKPHLFLSTKAKFSLEALG
jgi:hypothetical protein